MIADFAQFLFFLEMLILIAAIFMHLSKKSSSVVNLYMLQSLVVSGLLLSSFFSGGSISLLLVLMIVGTFGVKVLIAPYFFHKLITKNHIKFSASTYLNAPLTLIVVASLIAFAYSRLFQPLTNIFLENSDALLLALAAMFVSIFLLINRKGAMSQAVGILSLENAIVSFAFLAGLEQSPALQLGIIFDILAWVFIAGTITTMVYQHIESLDISTMRHLKEE